MKMASNPLLKGELGFMESTTFIESKPATELTADHVRDAIRMLKSANTDYTLHISVKDEAREYNLAIREGRDPEKAVDDYKRNHGYYIMWTHYGPHNSWVNPYVTFDESKDSNFDEILGENPVLKRTGWMPNVSDEDDPGNED